MEELRDEEIFFTLEDNDDIIYSVDRSQIETLNWHETYNNHGILCDHTDAGDYTFKNGYSDAIADMVMELELTDMEEKEAEELHCCEISELDVCQETKDRIQEWLNQNEQLTQCKGFTYWNGHNFNTIIVEDEDSDQNNAYEVDDATYREMADVRNNEGYTTLPSLHTVFNCIIKRG